MENQASTNEVVQVLDAVACLTSGLGISLFDRFRETHSWSINDRRDGNIVVPSFVFLIMPNGSHAFVVATSYYYT